MGPDHRIEWHSISGTPQAGQVSFRELAPNGMRVLLETSCRPQGAAENRGAAPGVLSSRVDGDLTHFKQVAKFR